MQCVLRVYRLQKMRDKQRRKSANPNPNPSATAITAHAEQAEQQTEAVSDGSDGQNDSGNAKDEEELQQTSATNESTATAMKPPPPPSRSKTNKRGGRKRHKHRKKKQKKKKTAADLWIKHQHNSKGQRMTETKYGRQSDSHYFENTRNNTQQATHPPFPYLWKNSRTTSVEVTLFSKPERNTKMIRSHTHSGDFLGSSEEM